MIVAPTGDAAGAIATTPRIALRFAATWPQMLLPVGTIPQISIDAAVAALPTVPNWFRGVLGRRGTMVPVFDVPAAYGAAPANMKASHIIVLDPDADPLAALCSELPEVVAATPIADGPARDVPASLLCYLSRPMLVNGVALHEFAFRHWLAEFAPRLGG